MLLNMKSFNYAVQYLAISLNLSHLDKLWLTLTMPFSSWKNKYLVHYSWHFCRSYMPMVTKKCWISAPNVGCLLVKASVNKWVFCLILYLYSFLVVPFVYNMFVYLASLFPLLCFAFLAISFCNMAVVTYLSTGPRE